MRAAAALLLAALAALAAAPRPASAADCALPLNSTLIDCGFGAVDLSVLAVKPGKQTFTVRGRRAGAAAPAALGRAEARRRWALKAPGARACCPRLALNPRPTGPSTLASHFPCRCLAAELWRRLHRGDARGYADVQVGAPLTLWGHPACTAAPYHGLGPQPRSHLLPPHPKPPRTPRPGARSAGGAARRAPPSRTLPASHLSSRPRPASPCEVGARPDRSAPAGAAPSRRSCALHTARRPGPHPGTAPSLLILTPRPAGLAGYDFYATFNVTASPTAGGASVTKACGVCVAKKDKSGGAARGSDTRSCAESNWKAGAPVSCPTEVKGRR
jgi:hypothetical protein